MRKALAGILLGAALFACGCVSLETYPGSIAYKTDVERQAAYDRFAIAPDDSGTLMTAQGHPVARVRDYAHAVAPEFEGPKPPFWAPFNAYDALALGAVGAIGIQSFRYPWGFGAFLGSLMLWEAPFLGRVWEEDRQHAVAFDQALAKDLGLPEPRPHFPVAGDERQRPHWDFSFATGATHLSALDYQDFFTPPGRTLSFRFQDQWFTDVDLALSRRWPNGFSLGLELDILPNRSYWARWSTGAGVALYDETIRTDAVISSIRLGQHGRPWEDKTWTAEYIARIGWGVINVDDTLNDPNDKEAKTGYASYVSGAPAWGIGLGIGRSVSAYLDLQLELGYRSVRTGALRLVDRVGTLATAPSTMVDPYGRAASFDLSGPYLRLGLMSF